MEETRAHAPRVFTKILRNLPYQFQIPQEGSSWIQDDAEVGKRLFDRIGKRSNQPTDRTIRSMFEMKENACAKVVKR